MTAQIDDTFRYRGRKYAVVGISEGELFAPSLLGLQPAWESTACWRGYHAVFGLSGARLVLDALHINLLIPKKGYEHRVLKPREGDKHRVPIPREGFERQEGPEINGVKPTGPKERYEWFNNHYEGIGYHLEYSGGLLLADGFIRELYVHMGFHPAWKYETVIELIFDAGLLKEEIDRSDRMAEIREMAVNSRNESDDMRMPKMDEIRRFVERAFDRSYRM